MKRSERRYTRIYRPRTNGKALACRLVDAPHAPDGAHEDVPADRTSPVRSFPELLARTADADSTRAPQLGQASGSRSSSNELTATR
jgi:hypothetical protein